MKRFYELGSWCCGCLAATLVIVGMLAIPEQASAFDPIDIGGGPPVALLQCAGTDVCKEAAIPNCSLRVSLLTCPSDGRCKADPIACKECNCDRVGNISDPDTLKCWCGGKP